jgi:hypothetical protein
MQFETHGPFLRLFSFNPEYSKVYNLFHSNPKNSPNFSPYGPTMDKIWIIRFILN